MFCVQALYKKMPVFLSDQLKDAGTIRIEILKTLTPLGNKRFILWVTEMDDQSMVHEFSSLLSIDTYCSSQAPTQEQEEVECSTILLTRFEEDDSSTLESVSIGCFTQERSNQLRDFIKTFVNSGNGGAKGGV